MDDGDLDDDMQEAPLQLAIKTKYVQFMGSNHRKRKCERCPPNSLRPISYFGSIWELKFLLGKRISYIFPWTRDTQFKNSPYSLARNTPNAS